MIPLWQLESLAVWYAAGYRYRLEWNAEQWRFVYVQGK